MENAKWYEKIKEAQDIRIKKRQLIQQILKDLARQFESETNRRSRVEQTDDDADEWVVDLGIDTAVIHANEVDGVNDGDVDLRDKLEKMVVRKIIEGNEK